MTVTSAQLTHFLAQCGKRHLIITGRKGVGKTTLFNQLGSAPREGLRTSAQWDGGQRPACILMENLTTGASAVCALPGPERMVAVDAAFTQVGLPTLTQALENSASLFFMDEIGYFEWSQQAYCQALLAIFDTKSVVAVVKKEDTPLTRLILQRNDVYVLDLDEAPH